MDSMSVLGQQSQNKIQSDYLRLKNEENRIPGDPRPSKNLSAAQFLKKDVENKNPGSNINNQSRLPVLAKSLNLHISKEFAKSHKGWEDKPLAGKAARSKKPCTKPLPFNFSQPRSKRTEPQSQRPSRTFTARAGRNENTDLNSNRTNINARTPNKGFGVDFAAEPSSPLRLASTKPETLKGTSSTASLTSHAPEPMALAPEDQLAAKTMHLKTFVPPTQASTSQASTEACLNNLDLLSIKDPSKLRTLQASIAASSSSGLSGKEEAFQLDHAALLSILRNEWVGALPLGSATPGSTKPYKFHRVTITKSHHKAGPDDEGPMRVPLDPASKRSTLQGKGTKDIGALEKTPSNSVRPSGRGTSDYTARRVPLTRTRGETLGRATVAPHEGTPAMKWTPQRVPNTRNQLMSGKASMHKIGLSAHPVSLQARPSEPQPHHKDVVQRLFEDQDDEQNMTVSDGEPKSSTTEGPCWADGDVRVKEATEVEEEPKKEGGGGARPFLQEPHRESVIFFSTGKKLFRAPRVEKPEGPAQAERLGDAHTDTAWAPIGRQPGFEKPFASVLLKRDFLVPKNCPVEASPATTLPLKRRLLLDELRLDEEVAAYTCGSAPEAQPYQPPRPRCGNPLASFLHFQDATMFVPVGCEGNIGSTSPLRQR